MLGEMSVGPPWALNQAFAKHALAACTKGVLALQSFPAGLPQASSVEEDCQELRAVLASVGAL